MVTVAVPGGNGGTPKTQDTNPVLAVDYDVDTLTKVLEENNIEVVISAIFIFDDTPSVTEINVLRAVENSKTMNPFIISNWGIPMPPEELQLAPQKARLAVMAKIKKTSLEWTQFYNGFFLDYYGMPYIQSHLKPVTFVLNMATRTAVIPGTGDEKFPLTYSQDLGKFVAAMLELPKWEESFCAYSENTTWNRVVKQAEELTGAKLKITYDSTEKLMQGESTEMPLYATDSYLAIGIRRAFQARFGLYVVHGLFTVPEEKALNRRFQEMETTTVEEVLGLWKSK